MTGEIYMEVRCVEPSCPWGMLPLYGVEFKDVFKNAYDAAMEHAWKHREHCVEIWHEGEIRARCSVREVRGWNAYRESFRPGGEA